MNIKDVHIHFIVSEPPGLSVSLVMEMIKGRTAIMILKSFPLLKKKI